MKPQRISAIKASLQDMTLEELQDMSDDLDDLIQVLITRQVAVEDVILDRLEAAFAKWILMKISGTNVLLNLPMK